MIFTLHFLIILSFIIATLFLAYFSWRDIKTREVENLPIFAMFVIGFGLSLARGELFSWSIGTILFGILGYFFWKKINFGGADFKIFFCLPAFLGLVGFPNMIVGLWYFLIFLMISAVLYSSAFFFWRKFKWNKFFNQIEKEEKNMTFDEYLHQNIPFVPAIFITYLIFIIFRVRWFAV